MDDNYYWKKKLTLAEILEELEHSDNSESADAVYILPPANEAITDEESGDEEEVNLYNLPHSQLNMEAEVSTKDKPNSSSSNTDNDNRSSKHKKYRCWEKGDIDELHIQTSFFEGSYPPPLCCCESTPPIDYFKLFLSKDIIDEIAKYTTMYAAQKNLNLCVDTTDIYAFIGILFVSGYLTPNRRRLFWENRDDTNNKLVTNTMRRNRFDEIFRHFHVCDNHHLPTNDKYGKVRPLVDKINENFVKFAPIETNLTIDESMIKYYGRHSCKQFLKGKPIRFGYKAWSLATKSGYCVQFDLYQGKDPNVVRSKNIGLGQTVILKFSKFIESRFPGLKFSYFFDNFFTSGKLIQELTERGIGGTGTVRENRTDRCPIISNKDMKRNERGSLESYIDKEHKIIAVKWMDNSVVTILSNEYGIEPLKKALRFSVKQKKKVEIPQPNCINMYNKYMGGVDQMDNLISRYPISFRGKKWYISLIFWMFDVAMNNAWLLSRQYGSKLDKLEFVRQVATDLCTIYGTQRQKSGPYNKARVSESRKISGQHLVITGDKRKTCALCKNRTVTLCESCAVPLHKKCFVDYHK